MPSETCPDSQWGTLFALARYGGLRCPSETLNLRWQDIDWDNQRMSVRSLKTEHHAGRESRQVPICPERLPHLAEAFDLAEDGDEFVITRYRRQDANLRTQLQKIIRRAGLKVWKNLRSSRETELVETFPVHVAAAWLGNTEAVANKHYLQVTDDHFTKAVKSGAESGSVDAKSGSQAAHFPAQQPAAPTRVDTKKPLTESGVTRSNASECGTVRYKKLPDPYSMRTSGLVEVGAYCINRLRRSATVEFHCWKPISGIPKPEAAPRKPKSDRMRLPLYYQSLLDSGVVQTRAELARYLGVSRARVTQVLRRFDDQEEKSA
jgi:hypothetical protein